MNRRRRLVVVLACVGCLLAVASALPAADPRLDAPGGGGSASAGDWESIVSEPTPAEAVDGESDGGETDDESSADGSGDGSDTGGANNGITVDGALEPGNEVTVEIVNSDGISHFDPPTMEVNGEAVGEPSPFGRVSGVPVPHAETMTVEVPERDLSATFDVRTDATVRLHGSAAPGAERELSAAVGSTPLRDATVSVDGEPVATTGDDGRARITLPREVGEATVTVERDPIAGTETVAIAAPEVSFDSPLLVPGSLAPVRVTADGGGVPNATVAVVGGDEAAVLAAMDDGDAATIDGASTATTDDGGHARLWLPLDDEATVVATTAGQTATATVGNLYLRLTAVLVVVPGLLIGGSVTYLRLARRYDHEPGNEFAVLFVGLAELFDRLASLARMPSVSLPSFSWPRIRVPTGLGRSIGAALGGVLAGFASLASLPSLPSLGSERSSSRGSAGSLVRSGIDSLRGSSDDDASEDAESAPLADEPLGPSSPRRTVRAAWHAFCDRLGVRRRETRSPGEVARRAVDAGYPSGAVNELLSTLRDVEYGGRSPTPDRAARAHDAATGLLAYDPDGDDPDGDEMDGSDLGDEPGDGDDTAGDDADGSADDADTGDDADTAGGAP